MEVRVNKQTLEDEFVLTVKDDSEEKNERW